MKVKTKKAKPPFVVKLEHTISKLEEKIDKLTFSEKEQILSDRITRLELGELTPSEKESQLLVDRILQLEQDFMFLETRLLAAHGLNIEALNQKIRHLYELNNVEEDEPKKKASK